MSLNRYAARRDANEHHIISALERCGAQVEQMSQPCDLLVYFRSRHFPLEVTGIKKYRKRSPKQVGTLERMRIPQVGSVDEALRAIGAA